MDVHLTLHIAAVMVAAVALVSHPGMSQRSARGDLVAAAIMTAAMVEAMWVQSVPVVYSMGGLIFGAIIIAGLRGRRALRTVSKAKDGCSLAHTPFGLVATAACLPFMHPLVNTGATLQVTPAHSHHGSGGPTLLALAVMLSAAYLLISIAGARRAATLQVRCQFILMGVSMAAMAAAVIIA